MFRGGVEYFRRRDCAAHERPLSELQSHRRVLRYKHGASIDWIIGGDLKFLRQMKENAKAAAAINNPGGLDASGPDTRIMNIGRSLLALPLEKRDFALIVVQELLMAARARNV
jgi:hypothetical protein